MIQKRTLGRAGLSVTALGYGAMELRNPGMTERAEEVLNTVLDAGITFLDTSPDYGPSEELIGRYLSGRRSEFVLATKCACNTTGIGPGHIFTAEQFAKNLDESLRRLKTDHIDLWQIHCVTPPDLPGGPDDPAVRFMRKVKADGTVSAIGISFKNGKASDPAYPTEHQKAFAREMAGWGVFDTIQLVYGALMRVSEEDIAAIAQTGTGIIARGALQRYFPESALIPERAGLAGLCEEGEDINAFLLRFALADPHIGTVICGSGNPAHIRANVRAAETGPLPADIYMEAKRRLDALG